MNPAGRVRCKHAAEIKLLCQLLQLKPDRRRCSIGHHALCGGGVVASLDPPAREPRRVGACSVSARDKKPRLGRGLKYHLPEGNKPIACTTGRTTMLGSAAPVTRCFGRSTNRPVLPASKPFQQPKRRARKAPPKSDLGGAEVPNGGKTNASTLDDCGSEVPAGPTLQRQPGKAMGKAPHSQRG
jgi:hypothetical protein